MSESFAELSSGNRLELSPRHQHVDINNVVMILDFEVAITSGIERISSTFLMSTLRIIPTKVTGDQYQAAMTVMS